MDVRIGVTDTPKEIDIELPEGADSDQLVTRIEAALSSDSGVLWLTDRRGRRVGVPAARVGYIEIDANPEERRVGFGAGMK